LAARREVTFGLRAGLAALRGRAWASAGAVSADVEGVAKTLPVGQFIHAANSANKACLVVDELPKSGENPT
jgi:hypothetical protein